jgi:WD40 repeat protein/uncharacterized caspase-like protein
LKSGRVTLSAISTYLLPAEAFFPYDLAITADGRFVCAVYALRDSQGTGAAVWDIASGQLLRSWLAHTDRADKITVSPDGRWLLTGAYDKLVKLWELSTGRLVRQFKGHSDFISDVAFSADGNVVFSASGDNTIRAWSVSSGQPKWIIQLDRSDSRADGLLPTADGRGLFYGIHDIFLADTASGKIIRTIKASSSFQQYVQALLAPNGNLLVSSERGLSRWDLDSGQLTGISSPSISGLASLKNLEPSQKLTVSFVRNTVQIWESNTDNLVRIIEIPKTVKGFLKQVALSGDGRLIATASYDDRAIKLWDSASGRLVRSIATGMEVVSVSFSADGRLVASAEQKTDGKHLLGSSIRLWDVATGELAVTLAKMDDGFHEFEGVSFSPQPETLVATRFDSVELREVKSGRVITSFKPGSNIEALAVSADQRFIATTGGLAERTKLWSYSSGELLFDLEGAAGAGNSIVFSPQGRRLIAVNTNGTISIWSTETGELLANLMQADTGEWVTITPEGFFVASSRGAELLYVVRGFETIGIDQFYQSLYRPDLVREKLAGDPRGLVREAAAQLDLDKAIASGNAPDVRLTLPGRALGAGTVDGNSVSADAEIADRGGGIGRVEWRVNGVTAGVDNPAPASPGQPLRLTRSLALDAGGNTIEVVAYNGANLIASVPARVNVAAQVASPTIVPSQPATPSTKPAPAPVAAAKPRLFVLVAGVNDYADRRFRLSYAVSDAKEVARGFQEASGNLYQSVEVKLMTDAEVTREKLDAAFAEIAGKAAASDVFVLYLAGHGKTVDGRYYFVPQDFAIEGELTDKIINAAVKTKAIAQDQWQRWFASIPARKSVILFDTCDSGTLAGDETQQLAKGAANDRLSQATGRSILAASGGSQEALEGYRGHGLFTYEILDAINQADGDRSGTVELNELAAYVYAQVSELSQKVFRQRQVPEMKITANFPLAKQTRILQDEVTPVAEVKPTYQLAQTASLQIKPASGATVVRSLSAKTPVTVRESSNGWSLVASEGKPLGYIATRDLTPVH